MARNWIVRGDPTSSGGSVISGSPFTDIDGIAVARITDQATCLKHRGVFPIVEGDATLVVDGQPVALHGSALACGCKVLSAAQMHVFVDVGGAAASNSVANAQAVSKLRDATNGMVGKGLSSSEDDVEIEKFDESIRFVNEAGEPLVGVQYALHLVSGRVFNGVTDDLGMTSRIVTDGPEEVVKAVLAGTGESRSCCAFRKQPAGEDEATLELHGVRTNSREVGDSSVDVKAMGHERDLTSGEKAIATAVFGSSVDLSKVKIHDHGYWLFFGFQEKYTAVTPNGEMYFPKAVYKDDFSLDPQDRSLFVHEMVHVWQHQLGYAVRTNGLLVSSRGAAAYRYVLSDAVLLSEYNMEQQADIISDYYMIVLSGDRVNARGSGGTPDQLKAVLTRFLSDPSSKDNLPRGR